MSILKYIERLKRMDDLIRRRATGTPDQFADKLGICKSMLMINLAELKTLGGPIKYNSAEGSYYYSNECQFRLGYEAHKNSAAYIKGGNNFSPLQYY